MPTEMDSTLEQAAKALRRNRFGVKIVPNADEARNALLDLVPPEASVGIGDSTTVRQLEVLSELDRRGNVVVNPFRPEIIVQWDRMVETMRAALRTDIFLTGSNALTLDGKLVSTDMVGNRVAGMFFGPPKVVLVLGRNKLVDDLDAALARIRLFAPYHAGHKGRKTPCAPTCECDDCTSTERICNVTLVLEHKPLLTEITVILVDEDVGLSWDAAWPRGRIDSIKQRYQKFTRVIPVPKSAYSTRK